LMLTPVFYVLVRKLSGKKEDNQPAKTG
jgi:hypothetical protein